MIQLARLYLEKIVLMFSLWRIEMKILDIVDNYLQTQL
jgi:hypothetical protein